jgi:hypothetical protein
MLRILYLSLFFLVSCANPKKLHRMMDNLPEATAKECADRFPIKETIETITVADSALLHQYEIEFNYMASLIDSLLSANCDTVHIEKIKEVIKKIPCKPETKIIIKTQENTAKSKVILDSCQKVSSLLSEKLSNCDIKVNELTTKCDKYKGQRDWLFWLIIALLIWIFRKQIALLFKLF